MQFGNDDNIVKIVSVGLTYVAPLTVWMTSIGEKADKFHNLISLSFMALSILLGFAWKLVDVRMKYNKSMKEEFERGLRAGIKESDSKTKD